MHIDRLFAKLSSSPGQGHEDRRFNAVAVPKYPEAHVAKDNLGRPAVLFESRNGSTLPALPALSYENLRAEFNVACMISGRNGRRKASFSLVRCLSVDFGLQQHFLRIMEAGILTCGRKPELKKVLEVLTKAAELFRVLALPPQKSVQGLWGELFVIAGCTEPLSLMRAWRGQPEDQFDFNSGPSRLEVKTTSTQVRSHRFSFEQLNPPKRTKAVIASLFVERAGGGVSLADLMNRIRRRLEDEPQAILTLESIVAQTLGNTWENALENKFDAQSARASLRFMRAEFIPCVHRDLPAEVSDVHFASDITAGPFLSRRELERLGGLFVSL